MAAETPSSPPSSPPPPPPPSTAASQYWCYHCDKRVSVETQPGQPDDAIICNECKFGFVESIQLATSPSVLSPPHPPDHHLFAGGGGGGGEFSDEPTLGNQFLQVLRLLAQVAREDDAPPPPPPPPQPRPLNPEDPSPSDESDFLRIEIDGWDEDDENENENGNENNNDDNNNSSNDIFISNGDDDVEVEEEEDEDDDDEDDDDEDDVRSVEIVEQSDEDEDEREEDIRRRRRDVLRLRLRDFANRARSEGRNRILDWAEILMGLEDNSIEFRFELPEATTDRYIGNPGDYVDAAEYEALLQNLADAEGRRGAPPASKAAVEGLKVVEIKTLEESYVCAICKDGVNVGEVVKEMPCGHGYHGDCIVPWLASRNSCPVCRFELPTEDADYEEERKKKFPGGSSSGSSAGNSV